MMLPTHALAGMLVALPVALFLPEIASSVILGGLLGGIVPDLDLYLGHRKTLHYPVYYPLLAVGAVGLAAIIPTPITISVAVFLIAAALHCVSDLFGGGLELRPWEATSERAVFSHYHDRWLSPRRWVAYDGSPKDLLLSVILAVPLVLTVETQLRWLVFLATGIALIYTIVRRLLPHIAEWVVRNVLARVLPDPFFTYVPTRYRDHRRTARSR